MRNPGVNYTRSENGFLIPFLSDPVLSAILGFYLLDRKAIESSHRHAKLGLPPTLAGISLLTQAPVQRGALEPNPQRNRWDRSRKLVLLPRRRRALRAPIPAPGALLLRCQQPLPPRTSDSRGSERFPCPQGNCPLGYRALGASPSSRPTCRVRGSSSSSRVVLAQERFCKLRVLVQHHCPPHRS